MAKRKERFELFRLSLLERVNVSLFADHDEGREAYLRRVFGTARTFNHYTSKFHYVPHPEISAETAMMGAIGRQVEAEENLSPGEGLAESIRETWKASVFILDPTDHPDGQKAAIEDDKKVGGVLSARDRPSRRDQRDGRRSFRDRNQPDF